jgi:mono/diheme cytochrome c family protein
MQMMSDATLYLVIKNGSTAAGFPPGMPAFDGTLDSDKIAALIHYIRSFCSGELNEQSKSVRSPSSIESRAD